MAAVVSAVFSSESSELHEARDAGIVILIKVVMDIFLEKGAEAAFVQVASLLRKPLVRDEEVAGTRCAVFDVLANLMIHGELLYGAGAQDVGHAENGTNRVDNEVEDGSWMDTVKRQTSNRHWIGGDSADTSPDQMAGREKMDAFRAWLRRILFHLLDAYAQYCDANLPSTPSSSPKAPPSNVPSTASNSAVVWASALSCTMSLCTRDGLVVREWVEAFPLSALKQMLQVSRSSFWSTRIQSLLACMACNVVYVSGDSGSRLDRGRVDEFGGVSGVAKEYQYAPTGIACSSLFCLLLDSVGTPDGVAKAMLRSGAAEVLRDYLILPGLASDEDVSENLSRFIHGICLASEDLAGIEFDDVLECVRSLKGATSSPFEVPKELEASFEATLQAGVFAQTESQHWEALRSLLVSDSVMDRNIGRSWTVKLMMSVLDACVTQPTEKNAIIPPPVPLLPSSAPGRVLFTLGDTILSAFSEEKTRRRSRDEENEPFSAAADDMVTNFALAVRQVVSGIRFRTLNIGGALHSKWNAGGVDPDRLCISTIERAFEWITGFSSAPEWSSAITLMVESMITVVCGCSKSTSMHIDGVTRPSTPLMDSGTNGTDGTSPSDERGPSQQQTPEGPAVMPPLHIPSPSIADGSTTPGSTGPLSPLTKIVPGLWRRLKTPGSSRAQKNTRPSSGESQSSNTDMFQGAGVQRPLSAGVVAMDASERERAQEKLPMAPGIGTLNLSNTPSNLNDMAPASRVGSVTAHAHNTQWVPLAEKVARSRDRRQRETLLSLSTTRASILAYNRTVDPIESFISATSTCPRAILDMLSPNNLRDVFDAMSQVRGVDTVQLGVCNAGKPFWDARLAIFILLVSSYTQTEKNRHNHPLLKSASYAQSLIRDPDLRVRHHACAFLLHRFSEQNRAGFIKATRAIVSRAQQSDDESLLLDPEMRVRKMLDLNMINFDKLAV